MTLHAAKGLEFDRVFLTGWEEGLFPHQRALDESGLAGLEEERRLAYVGITRGRKHVHISFAQNRRLRGLFQSAVPSRFVDELPETHVDVVEAKSQFGGAYAQSFGGGGGFGRQNPYGKSRFDDAKPFASTYDTPGWQRAQQNEARFGNDAAQTFRDGQGRSEQNAQKRRQFLKQGPLQIEGKLVAASTAKGAGFKVGDRALHAKFGEGTVTHVDGEKLTIEFDNGDRKRVVDSFVDRI
jgi:DNA helicase II / ATP-dependent DNA helicase PcrA